MEKNKKTLRNNGYNTKDGFGQIGFLFNNLGPTQETFTCIYNSNKWLNNNVGTDVCAFFEEQSVPCTELKFARYNIADVSHFYGNLICSSIRSITKTDKCVRPRRFFYIYDLEYIRSFENMDSFTKIMNNNKIVKFTRSKDYLNRIKEDGFIINDTIVEDYDIPAIIKIIKETNEGK